MPLEIGANYLDEQCRALLGLAEMFPQAARTEIHTNILDPENDYVKCGMFIVSSTRTAESEAPIIGVEHRKLDLYEWNKEMSDVELFGGSVED